MTAPTGIPLGHLFEVDGGPGPPVPPRAAGRGPVLSIGKLAPGRADYYLGTVARGAEEYYIGSGEAPGRWLGRGAERLGLTGGVARYQLRRRHHRAPLDLRPPRRHPPPLRRIARRRRRH